MSNRGFIFDDIFSKMFGLTPQFMNEFELVSVVYKDKDGLTETVFNEELHNTYKEKYCENCNKVDDVNKNDNSYEECACGECDTCVERKVVLIDKIRENFLNENLMRDDNQLPANIADLKDGDYVYAVSDATAFYGIYRERKDNKFYFHITINSDGEETPSENIAFVDCCFGEKTWKFYNATNVEIEYIDSVLAAEEWYFDKDVCRVY